MDMTSESRDLSSIDDKSSFLIIGCKGSCEDPKRLKQMMELLQHETKSHPTNKVKTEKNESEKNADLDATSNCKEVPKSTMTPMPESESGTKLSKNQLRKRKRQEYLAEKKIQKKLQKKEVKRQKALAEGRDLDKERKIQAENAKRGEGRKRREELWLKRAESAKKSFGVCIDCSYEDKMTPKEINSLSQQIRYCYASNRRSKNPVYLSVANLAGVSLAHMHNVAGFPDQWLGRSFSYSETKSIVEMHNPDAKSKLVYLTSDSDTILEHLDDSKIYVIGGIVDCNRLKRAAINKAEEFGLQTAKLPITDYFKLVTTKVLTCNHVFDILLKYREMGNDWKKAMLNVLPPRKDMEILENKEEVKEEKSSEGKTET